MEKRIGILITQSPSNAKRVMYGASLHYCKLAQQYGHVSLVMPDDGPEHHPDLDMLILPGGPDVSTAITKAKKFPFGTGRDNPVYTHFFTQHFHNWVDAGVPILGICLGMQAINSLMGGTLMADMFGHNIKDQHYIYVNEDKEVGLNRTVQEITSRHHQAVHMTGLADGFIPVAYGSIGDEFDPGKVSPSAFANKIHKKVSEGDKWIIEAFRSDDSAGHKIAGVQGHPEDTLFDYDWHGDEMTHKLILWLLGSSREATQASSTPKTGRKYETEASEVPN